MTIEELKELAKDQTKHHRNALAPTYDVMMTLSSRGEAYKTKAITIAIYNDGESKLKSKLYVEPVWDDVTMRIYLLPSTKAEGYKGYPDKKATRFKFTNNELSKLIEESNLTGSYRLEKDGDCGIYFISLFEKYRKYQLTKK